MTYKVFLDKSADKFLEKLNKKTKDKILFACFDLKDLVTKKIPNVEKLKKPYVGFRRRVGNYRILFRIENSKQISIYKIRLRKDSYKK